MLPDTQKAKDAQYRDWMNRLSGKSSDSPNYSSISAILDNEDAEARRHRSHSKFDEVFDRTWREQKPYFEQETPPAVDPMSFQDWQDLLNTVKNRPRTENHCHRQIEGEEEDDEKHNEDDDEGNDTSSMNVIDDADFEEMEAQQQQESQQQQQEQQQQEQHDLECQRVCSKEETVKKEPEEKTTSTATNASIKINLKPNLVIKLPSTTRTKMRHSFAAASLGSNSPSPQRVHSLSPSTSASDAIFRRRLTVEDRLSPTLARLQLGRKSLTPEPSQRFGSSPPQKQQMLEKLPPATSECSLKKHVMGSHISTHHRSVSQIPQSTHQRQKHDRANAMPAIV